MAAISGQDISYYLAGNQKEANALRIRYSDSRKCHIAYLKVLACVSMILWVSMVLAPLLLRCGQDFWEKCSSVTLKSLYNTTLSQLQYCYLVW